MRESLREVRMVTHLLDLITYDFFRTFDLNSSWEGWYKQEERDL